jgi:glycosyltransferase involved in cell wall biosynthesis
MSFKISILTICYNRAETIEAAIQSVISQDYPTVEYIVVDGGSTDGTVELIEKYADRLHAFVTEPDKGMYNALNKAIGLATGDVIGILHSDDMFYSTDTLSKYADIFMRTNADVVYANGLYISEPLTPKGEQVKRIYRAKPFKQRYLNFGWIPLHTTIFVKREVFDKQGLYNENYQIASDYEISLRWFSNPELKKVFMNEWVVKMRLGGKSTTASLQKKKSTEDLHVIRRHKLLGYFTLAFKIARKIPQYLLPRIINYN